MFANSVFVVFGALNGDKYDKYGNAFACFSMKLQGTHEKCLVFQIILKLENVP